ncbi:MAG: signal peptidase I [Clostridia bacterium]|nr:signal peptidase I [Clostridia bacterium]
MNIISAITSILIVAVTFLLIFNICFNFIYTKRDVRGFSMQPTLNAEITDREKDGDVVYVNKFAEPEVNDIVVAEVKWNSSSVIKRLVGKPGDIVKIAADENGYSLYCNDRLLYTRPADVNTISYCSKTMGYIKYHDNAYYDQDNNFCVELQDDEYFLMGDHWMGSMLDCLSKGPVKKSEIIGRVDIVVEYTEDNKILSLGKSFINLIFGKKVSL